MRSGGRTAGRGHNGPAVRPWLSVLRSGTTLRPWPGRSRRRTQAWLRRRSSSRYGTRAVAAPPPRNSCPRGRVDGSVRPRAASSWPPISQDTSDRRRFVLGRLPPCLQNRLHLAVTVADLGNKKAPQAGPFFEADDGARTHDLLHGKSRQTVAAGCGEPSFRVAKPLSGRPRFVRFRPLVDILLTSRPA
jgi:hypothetical protein